MKVLFLNYEYPPLGGGAGNATKFLLQEYDKYSDLEVDLVTSAIDGEMVEAWHGRGVRVTRLPIGKDGKNFQKQTQVELLRYAWKAYWQVRSQIKRGQKYDVIHAFFSVPCGFLAMLLSWEFRIPYVVSLRGADVPGYAEKFKQLYIVLRPVIRRIWKHAFAVISNSDGLRQLAYKTNPNQEIGLIYNGVDTDFFRPNTAKRKRETKTILCASRLTERKGLRYALDAFARVAKKRDNVVLVIAGGDGDAAEALREQVKTLGLEKRVKFTGEYDHGKLLELQQSADIFLFPSLNEGMSNSMLEAMACGLPVIMTPTGGAQELIRDGENGFLVAFRDSEDIADKLEGILEDDEMRVRMGEKSRSVAEGLQWSNVAGQYREVYQQASRKDS